MPSNKASKESKKKPRFSDAHIQLMYSKEAKKNKPSLDLLLVKKLVDSLKKEMQTPIASFYNSESLGEHGSDDNDKHIDIDYDLDKSGFLINIGLRKISKPTKSQDVDLQGHQLNYFRDLSLQTEDIVGNRDEQYNISNLKSVDEENDSISLHKDSDFQSPNKRKKQKRDSDSQSPNKRKRKKKEKRDSHLPPSENKMKKGKKEHKESEGRRTKKRKRKSLLADDENLVSPSSGPDKRKRKKKEKRDSHLPPSENKMKKGKKEHKESEGRRTKKRKSKSLLADDENLVSPSSGPDKRKRKKKEKRDSHLPPSENKMKKGKKEHKESEGRRTKKRKRKSLLADDENLVSPSSGPDKRKRKKKEKRDSHLPPSENKMKKGKKEHKESEGRRTKKRKRKSLLADDENLVSPSSGPDKRKRKKKEKRDSHLPPSENKMKKGKKEHKESEGRRTKKRKSKSLLADDENLLSPSSGPDPSEVVSAVLSTLTESVWVDENDKENTFNRAEKGLIEKGADCVESAWRIRCRAENEMSLEKEVHPEVQKPKGSFHNGESHGGCDSVNVGHGSDDNAKHKKRKKINSNRPMKEKKRKNHKELDGWHKKTKNSKSLLSDEESQFVTKVESPCGGLEPAEIVSAVLSTSMERVGDNENIKGNSFVEAENVLTDEGAGKYLASLNKRKKEDSKCKPKTRSAKRMESSSYIEGTTETKKVPNGEDERCVKKFSCPFCPKIFWQINHLNTHKKIHLDSERSESVLCDQPLCSKTELSGCSQNHLTTGLTNPNENCSQITNPIEELSKADEAISPDLDDLKSLAIRKDLGMVEENVSMDDQKHLGVNGMKYPVVVSGTDDVAHNSESAPVTTSTKLKYKTKVGGEAGSKIVEEEYSDVIKMKCPLCHKEFSKLKNLRKHVANRHGSLESETNDSPALREDFEAGGEGKIHEGSAVVKEDTIFDHQALISQKINPTKEEPLGMYGCAICEKYFRTKKLLSCHVFVHLNIKPFVCTNCDASFSTKSSLANHKKVHANENSRKCPYCNKTFLRKRYIRVHMKIHEEEKRFICTVCNKAFRFKSGLNAHRKTHEDKSFSCDACEKKFYVYSALSRHKKVHLEVKNFTCADCDAKFSQLGHLKEHLRLHTNEKPYRCSECKMSFKQSSHLRNHQLTHIRIKSFECTNCSKSFSQSCHLVRHVVSCQHIVN